MNLSLDEIRFRIPVFLGLLSYFLVILYLSLDLSREPRLVPMLIVVPAIVLTILRIGTLLVPDLFAGYAGIFDVSNIAGDVDSGVDERYSPPKETVLIVGWFLGYLALIHLVGFVLSTVAFAAAFLYLQAGQSLVRSTVSAACIGVAVYLLFVVLINVRPLTPVFPVLP